jgi:hypothetical protein
MSFRPTPAQAIGRGGYLGALAGLAPFLIAVAVWAQRGWGEPDRAWLVLAPVLLGSVVGAMLTVAFGRRDGADIDDRGIHLAPVGSGFTSWRRVRDLGCERRRGRTQIVAHLDSGQVVWLRAPYHGRWLAGDREFERKLFMLRNLWETHRTFARDPLRAAVMDPAMDAPARAPMDAAPGGD